jgi:hypothetical protein
MSWEQGMRVLSAILLAVGIGGCAGQMQMAWIRADGMRISGDSTLTREFDTAKAACLGVQPNAPGAKSGGDLALDTSETARACMADKGFVLVRANEADAKGAELRAIAEKKRADETPAAPPPAQAPKRR